MEPMVCINSLDAIVLTLVQQVKVHRSDKWMSFARELYDRLDRLSQSDHTDDHESCHARQEVSWVLARKANESVSLPRLRLLSTMEPSPFPAIWVAACPLPRLFATPRAIRVCEVAIVNDGESTGTCRLCAIDHGLGWSVPVFDLSS